jgi:hypothetical protein
VHESGVKRLSTVLTVNTMIAGEKELTMEGELAAMKQQ